MNDLPPPPPPRRRPPWTAIAFIAGLLLGWLAIGWWLWPVQWANSAPPQLSAAFQEAYLAAVAEGYALTSDLAQVQARLAGWDETAVTNRLALMEQDAADPAAARRLADLRTALGLPQVNVTMLDLILGQRAILVSLLAAVALVLAAVGMALAPTLRQAQQRRAAARAAETALAAAVAAAPTEPAAAETTAAAAAAPAAAAPEPAAAAQPAAAATDAANPAAPPAEETAADTNAGGTAAPASGTAAAPTPAQQPPQPPPPDDLAQPEQQPAASGLRPPAPAPAQPDEDTPKPLLDNMDDTLQDILTDVFEDEDSLHVYQVLLQDVDEIPGTSLLQISSDTLAALRRHNRTRRRHAVRPKETT